ncbi:Cysteine desulfurase [Haliangium ochraceum DSM 14365]|uniref:Cysteine desulfurase IscS n=1 Tax=Haliangium ochraceum (strain DSM 14365 / JCM 11303 / SMP-2) TaxID=502025 RepID=D0LH13_HALO1|nr:IscS subfamily cysteine desulfurase [Haliangium ochraceum]ACY14735.1 Cysteine desulfurase [Haliangium ochraceum DSM 14365]
MSIDLPIYLDNHATTPCDPRVLEVMLPYFTEHCGNAASRSHVFGWTAEAAVDYAREQVATLIGASPREIVFTSGATEADNLAIKGVAATRHTQGKHIITAVTEHKAVLDSCARLAREGFEITYLTPGPDGLLTPAQVAEAVRDDTILVSVMFVNNEIGVVQPIAEIAAAVKAANERALVLCDAVQGVGKLPFAVEDMGVDLVALSAHKMYGPKGVGALWVRRRPRVRLEPLIDGGGHERGLRSGTLPVPLIIGFGMACELSQESMDEEAARTAGLRDRLLHGLRTRLDGVSVNGSLEHRVPGNLNLSFAGVDGESLLMSLKDVAVSSGSACTSATQAPSYVLRALGVDDELAQASLRFGVGRFNTEAQIDYVIELCADAVERLRALGPSPADIAGDAPVCERPGDD